MEKRRASLISLGLAAVGLAFAGSPSRAGIVITTRGQRISGRIVSADENQIKIRTDKGPIVTVNREEIVSISKEKPADTFAKKWKKLADEDVKGFLALAAWAKENKLDAQAAECWEKVLKTDTENADAREAL